MNTFNEQLEAFPSIATNEHSNRWEQSVNTLDQLTNYNKKNIYKVENGCNVNRACGISFKKN